MKLSPVELVVVGLLILYIAFFSHPPPSHIKDLLSSPVGHTVFLLGILYVTVYKSLVIGVFLGIAYVMTAGSTTEYFEENMTPSAGAGDPATAAALAQIMSSIKTPAMPAVSGVVPAQATIPAVTTGVQANATPVAGATNALPKPSITSLPGITSPVMNNPARQAVPGSSVTAPPPTLPTLPASPSALPGVPTIPSYPIRN